MRKSAIAAAVFLASGFSSSVYAQTAPSWRAASERPERLEAPPEVETPDISFEIDREALFGRPMGFAPAQERLVADPVSEPVPGDHRAAESLPSGGLVRVEPPSEQKDGTLSEPLAAQPEAPVEVEPGSLAATSNTPDAPVVGTSDVHAPVSAAERDALASAVRVDPELSMVSIDRPVPLSAPTSPGSPAGDYRLVRTRTVQPDYPREAARLGEEGWVDLRLTVAPDGRVADVEVLGAEPRQVFDAAARRAARQWRFEPPREAGIEEPMNAMIRLTFVMD